MSDQPVAPRKPGLIVACGSSAAAVGVAMLWRISSVPGPGESVMWTLFACGIIVGATIALTPVLVTNLPPRISRTAGGVAIRPRVLDPLTILCVTLALLVAAGICGLAGEVAGPRGSSPLFWGVMAAVFSWLLAQFIVNRPRNRRIELRPDGLTLRTGQNRSDIAWDDITAVDGISFYGSNSDKKMSALNEISHACLRITRRGEARTVKQQGHGNKLEDKFLTGGLACHNDVLVSTLRRLIARSEDRELLVHPASARPLFTRRQPRPPC